MDSFRNVTVNPSFLHVEIAYLEFFTMYEIRVQGFTIAGDGNISEPVLSMTDESGNVSI